MAKQMGGFLGPVVGKLGPVVGYLWRGRPVFRAYVRHIRYPNTVRQQVERDWFVGMVRFAAAVRPALVLGVHSQSVQAGMTEGNYFVVRNKQHFSSTADGLQVDYARLALSEGPVAPVRPVRLTVDPDGVLRVDFERNNALRRSRSTDSVHLCVYDATVGRGLIALPVRRRDGRVALRLPSAWAAHELHCYLFVTDAQGVASATAYAGTALLATRLATEADERQSLGDTGEGGMSSTQRPDARLRSSAVPGNSVAVVPSGTVSSRLSQGGELPSPP